MRIYYKQEAESGKHEIICTWLKGVKPEDMPTARIHNIPYNVLIIDEEYNPVAYDINVNGGLGKYYIDNSEQVWEVEGWVYELGV